LKRKAAITSIATLKNLLIEFIIVYEI